MSAPQTYKKIKLPPVIQIPHKLMEPEEAEEKVNRMVDEAYELAVAKINKGLSTVEKHKVHKLQGAAEEEGFSNAADYMRVKLNTISTCYIGYRTKLMQVREEDTDRDVTVGYISNALTDLSDSIGLHITEQIYRALSSSLDEVLEKHYGKPKGKY